MATLEVFFDYACPYCYRAHLALFSLLPLYPAIAPAWRPCEAHPRPERYGPHSDLCIRGMYYAKAQGISLEDYHTRVYEAIHIHYIDIEKPEALADILRDWWTPEAFVSALAGGAYEQALAQANAYAYDRCGVWVVPAYRMEGHALDAVEDVGISRNELMDFLERAGKAQGR